MRKKIEKELTQCLDANESDGETPVAFLAVIVSKSKDGQPMSTVLDVCEEIKLSRKMQDKLNSKMHDLGYSMSEAFSSEGYK